MKRRSGTAIVALGRKAGPMKHRLEPRGGSKPKISTDDADVDIDSARGECPCEECKENCDDV
jgi:hypothetical protein